MANCTISGTVLDQSGVVSPDARLVVTPLSVSGVLMSSHSRVVKAVAGVVVFDEVQNTVVRIEGNVLGFNSDDGTTVTVPASSSATLESLAAIITYPTTGLTLQDEGVALSGLYGTLNFVGGGIDAIQASAGIATITVSATPLDPDLAAIAALAGTSGLLKKTAADTWSLDTTAYASQAYADSLVVGLLDDRGNYNASVNTFPASGGSGAAGAILKGDLWTVSVAGTLGGHPVTAGDVVRALVDTPGQTDGNWAITENNFGYVAANAALSNLSTTSINQDLLPASTQKVGSAALPWLESYLGSTTHYEKVSDSAALMTHAALGSATNIGFVFTPKGTGNFTLSTGMLIVPQGTVGIPGILGSGTSSGLAFSVNTVALINGGARNAGVLNTQFALGSGGTFGWSDTAGDAFGSALATGFGRNAAAIIEANNGTAGRWAGLKAGFYGAATNSVANGITIGTRSSGTPAAGLGAGLLFNIDSSTTADQNAGQIYAIWTDATHATRSSSLVFSTVNAGGALTAGMQLNSQGALSVTTGITAGSTISVTSGSFGYVGRGFLSFQSDGVFTVWNAATSDFGRLQFGGTTSSFPALKRVSATLSVRLADDSAAADLLARSVRGNAVIFANVPGTPVEGMMVAVTDSSTATWRATITGGGANHVLAFYNGTNWTVAG